MFQRPARARAARASPYSGDSYHVFAASAVGNSMTTTRSGIQSPSRTVVAPPRTMNRPPCAATATVDSSR
jgi:hypothetical protein